MALFFASLKRLKKFGTILFVQRHFVALEGVKMALMGYTRVKSLANFSHFNIT